MGVEERRLLVIGALTDAHVLGAPPEGCRWSVVQVPTLEAADEQLQGDAQIHVALWAYGPGFSSAWLEAFSTVRARHRPVQWLALIPPECLEDTAIAALIAHDFFDYMTMPVERTRLFAWAGHAYGMSCLVERISAHAEFTPGEEQMVGTSEPMQALFRNIRKLAGSDAPVFISGESGTGKELTARAIHERSARARGPFVIVDCGSMPPSLIQSELFGYEKGAFTGAAQRKTGRIEAAEGGTLFLDEIGDLPLDLQTNLLRFLQESTISRVGSTQLIRVNARVIAASHVDLEEAVAQRRFREDLYYRLNVLRVKTPALRDRAEDIEVLARFFLAQFSKDAGRNIQGYTAAAAGAMRSYHWPGNVRELINRVRRAAVMCDGPFITAADLDLSKAAKQMEQTWDLEAAREIAEREAIGKAIRVSRNNHSAAARMLGVSRVTLYRLIQKHGVPTQRPVNDFPGS